MLEQGSCSAWGTEGEALTVTGGPACAGGRRGREARARGIPARRVSSGVSPAPYQARPGSQTLICTGPASSSLCARGEREETRPPEAGRGWAAWSCSLSLEGPALLPPLLLPQWPLGAKEEGRPDATARTGRPATRVTEHRGCSRGLVSRLNLEPHPSPGGQSQGHLQAAAAVLG